MTKAEIINKLEGDPLFAATFIADNNFADLTTKLNEKGLYPTTKAQAVQILLDAGRRKDKLFLADVLNIPYVASVPPTDASSLRDYFISHSPAPISTGSNTRSFDWSGLLVGLGATLTGVGAIVGGSNASGSSTDAATLLAQQQAAEAAAAAKRKKTWTIVGIIAAVIVVLIIVIYLVKRKK